ncbi:MAG: hypothetical protein ACUVTL_06285 [Thermoproteota archaeon]
MSMKVGKILHRFKTKDGREATLRTIKWEDLLQLINSLVEKQAEITIDAKKTREEEVDWLSSSISKLEKGNALYVVAEVDGKVVACSEITKRSSSCEAHVGDLDDADR